jgi:hypothetical protein
MSSEYSTPLASKSKHGLLNSSSTGPTQLAFQFSHQQRELESQFSHVVPETQTQLDTRPSWSRSYTLGSKYMGSQTGKNGAKGKTSRDTPQLLHYCVSLSESRSLWGFSSF